MSSEFAIRAEGLGKQYRIGAPQQKYRTLRDSLADSALAPVRAVKSKLGRHGANSNSRNRIWALKDISFDVRLGEVVGVIGRNGAGKSTLLRILSRITEPTTGKAWIHGRVGSLLEVGTGFHQELTGRENIYLNGAILGMKRREIDRKFDEIVDFSEVARFIDTPVKHYSSGMHLRLAFAVAAHLEPEILLVDEVLAVGDLAFQKKCLGKMEDVASRGRSVLVVSHNLGAVKELCETSIVLKDGCIDFRGPAVQGLAHYTLSFLESERSGPTGWDGVTINGELGGAQEALANDSCFIAGARLHLAEALSKARLYCIIDDSNGDCIAHHFMDRVDLARGRHAVSVDIPGLYLVPDAYNLYFKLIGRSESGTEERLVSERVILDITDRSGQMDGKVKAKLIPPLIWTVAEERESAVV